MPEAMLALLAAVAGGAGSVLRFVLDGAIMSRMARRVHGAPYPVGILVVNLSGSFAIGLLAGIAAGAPGAGHALSVVLGVGLLGGYTTFSTASYDTVRLLQRGRIAAGLLNGLGQLAAAVLAAGLGFALGSLAKF